MNYQQLKDFCNSLNEEQLLKDVVICDEDTSVICTGAFCIDEDVYRLDDTDESGPLEELKDLYPNEDLTDLGVRLSATKGTPFLSIVPEYTKLNE